MTNHTPGPREREYRRHLRSGCGCRLTAESGRMRRACQVPATREHGAQAMRARMAEDERRALAKATGEGR